MESRTLRSALGGSLLALAFVGAGCARPPAKPEMPTEVPSDSGTGATDQDAAGGTMLALGEEGADPAALEAAGKDGAMIGGDADVRQINDDSKDVSSVGSAGDAGEKDAEAVADGMRTIKVTARNWAFNPTEIRIKVGEKIRLEVTSVDVDHGFAVPQLGINITLKPGVTGSAEFTADKAGTYSFFCNVFCGSGHREMRGTLIVE